MKPDSSLQARPSSRAAAAACLLAMMEVSVEMGVGRFAFTPMLPLMARDGLLDPGAGAWLAGSNYLGYLFGALTVSRVRVSSRVLLRASLAGIVVVTAAMGAGNVDMVGWLALRFAAGGFSAWAFVLTSAWALDRLALARRPDLAGVVYAGVGLGIALVGAFCVVAAGPGVPAQRLWLGLGALSAFAIAPTLLLRAGSRDTPAVAVRKQSAPAEPNGSTSLVICYGLIGFGYILPATFLPALARTIVDDPRIFGLAWPVFGLASLLSTVVAARAFRHMNRLRVWAVSHLVMAAGVVMPSLWLSPTSIAIAALLVGGTYMVPAMIGLQEARARAPGDPTALLGRMTAAFAIGQLGGPLVSAMLGMLPAGHAAGLDRAFQAAALALVLSAAHLFRLARHKPAGV
jgi:MFS family permease